VYRNQSGVFGKLVFLAICCPFSFQRADLILRCDFESSQRSGQPESCEAFCLAPAGISQDVHVSRPFSVPDVVIVIVPDAPE
jgi:hypothetical protein